MFEDVTYTLTKNDMSDTLIKFDQCSLVSGTLQHCLHSANIFRMVGVGGGRVVGLLVMS